MDLKIKTLKTLTKYYKFEFDNENIYAYKLSEHLRPSHTFKVIKFLLNIIANVEE